MHGACALCLQHVPSGSHEADGLVTLLHGPPSLLLVLETSVSVEFEYSPADSLRASSLVHASWSRGAGQP